MELLPRPLSCCVSPALLRAQKLTLRADKLPELPAGHRQFVVSRTRPVQPSQKSSSELRTSSLRCHALRLEGPSRVVPDKTPVTDTTWWELHQIGRGAYFGQDITLVASCLRALLVCRSFQSIVAIVSCFTLAHSLTLALATL